MSLPKAAQSKEGAKTLFHVDGARLVGEVFPSDGGWSGRYILNNKWPRTPFQFSTEAEAIEAVRKACDEDFAWFTG